MLLRYLPLQFRRYHKQLSWSKTATIWVSVTAGIPLLAVLKGSVTSCQANFITWNKAYAMFPRSTFIDYKTYPLTGSATDDHGKFAASRAHLRQMGWARGTWPHPSTSWSNFKHPIDHQDSETKSTRHLVWPVLHRRVGDRKSWVVPLDTERIQPPQTPDWVLESGGFSVWLPHEAMLRRLSHCTIRYLLVQSHSLEYRSVPR